jgi:hypothetical protein
VHGHLRQAREMMLDPGHAGSSPIAVSAGC